jgi:hypothetical protein
VLGELIGDYLGTYLFRGTLKKAVEFVQENINKEAKLPKE